MIKYLHGYSIRENRRLSDQSVILEELLHSGTTYPEGSKVLEAGCGIGAQTLILAKRNPGIEIMAFDISHDSIIKAQSYVYSENITEVIFLQSDIFHIPFTDKSFDHIFVNFVLEHLQAPLQALFELKRVVKIGGTLTIIEGDHGSCFWHPETPESKRVWYSMIQAQFSFQHNPLIGRQLYPLLRQAGFKVKTVVPKWVYTDANNPGLMDGVLNKIIVPMAITAKDPALNLGLIDKDTWEKGIKDLENSGKPPDGTFFYTWFKGVAVRV